MSDPVAQQLSRPILNKRRRLVGLVASLAATSGVVAAVSLPTFTGTAEAVATIYTVSRTLGPYNGALPIGATVPCGLGCTTTAPGAIDADDEAPTVMCNGERDALLGGTATINRKTSYGTTERDVVNLDRLGAFWDSEVDRIKWGTWIRPNGRPGWNTVTLAATCLIRRA